MVINTIVSHRDNHSKVYIDGESGTYIGISVKWDEGQYLALQGKKGFVGCGIYNIDVAEKFGFAVAIAKGTPEKPLRTIDDLLQAPITAVTSKAREYGIKEGLSGKEAIKKLM